VTLSLLKNDEFRSPKAVVDFFRSEVTKNETPDQAGLEEEIIVLDHEGKAISHERFQEFLWDLISALPQGLAIAGTHIDGSTIPVLMGTFSDGSIQPETNTSLVEFAHNPCDSAWGHFIQSRRFSKQLHATAANHGLYVVGSGAVPTMSWGDFQRDDIIIPNSSFAYSVQHMRQGTRPEYCRTVYGTAGIHHNMGFNDPELMAQYITTSLRMQPTMIALLGNSPFWDSAPAYNGGRPIVSYRSLAQINYGKIFGSGDGVSYLYPDFLIDQSADFAAIINGYLDLPLDRTIVAGQKQPCPGLTMRHYLNGYAVDDRVHYPSVAALIMMIREPIVDVRPSFVGAASRVETRSHDCVSQHCAVAIDAI
jgi:gamma-glutamylcysteine synthetase